MKVEIIRRKHHIREEFYDEFFIENVPVDMGEGTAELIECHCEIHGKTKAISGYNQGGHDSMFVCLKCCKEIIAFLEKGSSL
jgi:hypothetical protein